MRCSLIDLVTASIFRVKEKGGLEILEIITRWIPTKLLTITLGGERSRRCPSLYGSISISVEKRKRGKKGRRRGQATGAALEPTNGAVKRRFGRSARRRPPWVSATAAAYLLLSPTRTPPEPAAATCRACALPAAARVAREAETGGTAPLAGPLPRRPSPSKGFQASSGQPEPALRAPDETSRAVGRLAASWLAS